jgi:hypothetical protein
MSRSVDYKSTNTFDTYEVVLEDIEDALMAEKVHMLSSFDKVYWNPYCVDGSHSATTPK